MAVSGWFVLLVGLGVVPLVATGQAIVFWLWLAAVAVITIIDLAFAGSPRQVVLRRELPRRVRLGETVASTLLVTNTGRRTIRGLVRDGWPPSAGATPRRARIDLPPGERRAFTTMLTPFRRGERNAAHVTIRS
ncbi:MAG: DUF11 domain-containing protein, partial [Salinibacterium sp.]